MQTRPGQSLLELVIAAGVIVTSVAASTTVIISTISSGRIGQSNIEAANYAREGVEIVRSIRDSNWLKSDANVLDSDGQPFKWDDNPSVGGYSPLGTTTPKYYVIDSLATVGTPGSTDGWFLRDVTTTTGQQPIRIYDQTGTNFQAQPATCSGCAATRYSRIIKIVKEQECLYYCPPATPSGSEVFADRLHVTSIVAWKERTGSNTTYAAYGFNRVMIADAYLYKWR